MKLVDTTPSIALFNSINSLSLTAIRLSFDLKDFVDFTQLNINHFWTAIKNVWSLLFTSPNDWSKIDALWIAATCMSHLEGDIWLQIYRFLTISWLEPLQKPNPILHINFYTWYHMDIKLKYPVVFNTLFSIYCGVPAGLYTLEIGHLFKLDTVPPHFLHLKLLVSVGCLDCQWQSLLATI